jgi:hypothetical protein
LNHEEIFEELIFHSQNQRNKNDEEDVKYKGNLVVKKIIQLMLDYFL